MAMTSDNTMLYGDGDEKFGKRIAKLINKDELKKTIEAHCLYKGVYLIGKKNDLETKSHIIDLNMEKYSVKKFCEQIGLELCESIMDIAKKTKSV